MKPPLFTPLSPPFVLPGIIKDRAAFPPLFHSLSALSLFPLVETKTSSVSIKGPPKTKEEWPTAGTGPSLPLTPPQACRRSLAPCSHPEGSGLFCLSRPGESPLTSEGQQVPLSQTEHAISSRPVFYYSKRSSIIFRLG